MARFSTEGLPRPVIVQPVDFEAAKVLRLGDYVQGMREKGIDYNVEHLEFDPPVIAAEAAAQGDTYFVQRLNDTGRAVLLPSFATDTDLDLHVLRSGLVRLEGETDAALRERNRLAQKGKSAAGPDDYYKSEARNYSPLVRDIAVSAETRNFSSRVLILSVLTTDNGGLITPQLADELEVVLNDPSFRARNVAAVEVIPAVITTKDIVANIYLYPETPETVIAIARQALLDAVTRDQTLGFDITRSYVERWLHQIGVQRVELVGWTDSYAAFNEAIRMGEITINALRVS